MAKIGIDDDPTVDISREMMANIDSVYLVSYALGQFIWGMFADRLGPRTVILGGMLLSIIATLTMGFYPIVMVFLLINIVQGLAQATGWSTCCKNLSQFFSTRERGRVMGFWCTCYAVGGLVSSPFAGWWAYSYFDDWRYAFFAPAAFLAIISVVVFLLQRNSPADIGLPSINEYHDERCGVPQVGHLSNGGAKGSWTIIREVLQNQSVLFLGAIYFLVKPARYAILFWGPLIVMEKVAGISKLVAVLIPVAFEFAGIFGPILLGYASDRYFGARRFPPCAISLALCASALFVFVPVSESFGTIGAVAIFFIIGITLYGPDALICGAAAVDFGTLRGAGTATGVVNGIGSIGAVLGGLLPGYVETQTLFYGFAGACTIAVLLCIPLWNLVPPHE